MEREQLIHLVQQAQAGDADAMDALFSAFYNDVYYFALKTVKDEDIACDITQETFVEILRTLGNLQEPAAFVRWMKQITYHQCTRYFSKKTEILVEEDEDGNTIFDTLADQSEDSLPAEVVEREDFRRTVMQMVDALTEEQRAAVLLYYFDEMTVGQIAEIQQVSAGTVKSRLNYARKALKKSVEDYEKKHNIKLCSFAPLALFLLYFGEAAMHPAKAAAVRAAVLAKNAGAAVAADAAAGAATAGGKAAAVPLWVKAVAGVVAAALAVGALVIAVSPDKERETPDRREEKRVMQTQEETKETPSAPTESTTTFSGDMLVLYKDSLEYRDIFRGYVSDECEMFYTDNGVGFYSDEQGSCVEYAFADIDYEIRAISSDTFYYYDSESLLYVFAEGKWYACPGAAGVPLGITFNYDTGYNYLYEVQTLDEQKNLPLSL